jgi:hypothetical protein
MIPDKYMELMNQQLDGTNTPEQTEELERYLADHPEARRHLEELTEAIGIFERVEAMEPPADLQARIAAATAPEPISFGEIVRRAFRFRREPSHAVAFATGLAAAVVLFLLITPLAPSGHGFDADTLYGTLYRGDHLGGGTIVSPFNFETPEVTGSASAVRVGDRTLVRLRLDSPRSVKVSLEAGEGARCEACIASQSSEYDLTFTEDRMELDHAGTGEYDIVYHDTRLNLPPLKLQIHADGTELVTESIAVSRD